jgi:hypothetical protein
MVRGEECSIKIKSKVRNFLLAAGGSPRIDPPDESQTQHDLVNTCL